MTNKMGVADIPIQKKIALYSEFSYQIVTVTEYVNDAGKIYILTIN